MKTPPWMTTTILPKIPDDTDDAAAHAEYQTQYLKAIAQLYYDLARRETMRGRYPAAVEHLEQAAALGLADAQCELGKRYAAGKGIPKDYEKAAQWFVRAADQKHELALTRLFLLFGQIATGRNEELKAKVYKVFRSQTPAPNAAPAEIKPG